MGKHAQKNGVGQEVVGSQKEIICCELSFGWLNVH